MGDINKSRLSSLPKLPKKLDDFSLRIYGGEEFKRYKKFKEELEVVLSKSTVSVQNIYNLLDALKKDGVIGNAAIQKAFGINIHMDLSLQKGALLDIGIPDFLHSVAEEIDFNHISRIILAKKRVENIARNSPVQDTVADTANSTQQSLQGDHCSE